MSTKFNLLRFTSGGTIRIPYKPLAERIYQYLLKRGPFGATTDEIEKALGLFHQSASPAVIQLRRQGYIGYNGQERPTRLGRPAKVHAVTANYIREAA